MALPDWQSIDIEDQAMAAVHYIRDAIPAIPEPDHDDADLAYVIGANTAWFLRDALIGGDTGYFPALFERIEELIVEGSPRARNLAVLGVLEDLQNATLQANRRPDEWRIWLGPKSELAWIAVDAFWNGDLKALGNFVRSTGLDLGE